MSQQPANTEQTSATREHVHVPRKGIVDRAQVTGHVMRPGADDMEPVANAWVVLHRVGSDSAGPIDSVRSSRDGEFHFSFRPFGVTDAVYFAAVVFDGIAYFTSPVNGQVGAVDDHADVTVFDTTSSPIPISVQGRHIIVSAPDGDGKRTITEVIEISNDTSVTRVAVGNSSSSAVWSIGLPARAHNPAFTEGEITADVVRFTDNRMYLYATLSPGIKQFMFTYTLDEKAFPLSIPLERKTSVLEVLLEEPAAEAEGGRLEAVEPAVVSARRFRRFLGSDVPANGVIKVTVPELERPVQAGYLVGLTILIGGAMVGALIYALRKR